MQDPVTCYHDQARGGASTGEPDDLLARLTAKQRQIARARPLPQATLHSMMDDFAVRYAHETTAIEGNTLTLAETQVVLEGITVGGKALREHLEVLGVRDAWEWLQGAVQPETPLDEEMILHLHRLLMKGILGDDAGRYRTVPVFISGSMHVPPNPIRVPALMAAFVERFRQRSADEHVVRYAAQAHIELAGIHPFVDGNGRVCRLLVNLLLMRDGWPPALYTVTNRSEYMQALEAAQYRREVERFVRVTAEAAEWMLDRHLHALRMVEEGERPT